MIYELTDIMNNHRWFIMGIAMISVVLFHQPWFDWGPWGFFHRTGFYGVEVFLFVSGWGIYQSLSRNSLKNYFMNRIVRLMPTCIFIGIIQAIFCLFGWNNGVNHPLAYILMCMGLFKWFIYAILFYYTLAPCIYRMLRHDYLFEFFLTIVFASIFLCRSDETFFEGSLLSVIPNILYRFPAFLMGMWLARYPQYFSSIAWFGLIFGVLFLFLVYDVYSSHYSVILNSFVFIATIPFLLNATLALNKYANNIIYQTIVMVGTCSLEVYLWHDFFFRGFAAMNFIDSNILFFISIIATIVFVKFTKNNVVNLSAKVIHHVK